MSEAEADPQYESLPCDTFLTHPVPLTSLFHEMFPVTGNAAEWSLMLAAAATSPHLC